MIRRNRNRIITLNLTLDTDWLNTYTTPLRKIYSRLWSKEPLHSIIMLDLGAFKQYHL